MIDLEVTRIATSAVQVTLPCADDFWHMKLDSYRISCWRKLARSFMGLLRPKPLSVSTEWFPHLLIRNIEQDILVVHAYQGDTIDGCSSYSLKQDELITLTPQQLGEEEWGWIAIRNIIN